MDYNHTPIQQKFLERNQLFGLEYREGMVFLSIRGYEDTQFREFNELEDIESNTSLDNGFQRLDDANGDDVLYVDKSEDPNIVLHAGIGQRPSFIRRFTRYPENEGKLRDIPNLEIPSSSDTYAFVDGRMSPYSNPTDAEELVIPPGQHLSFDFFNPDADNDHEPVLNVVMRKYLVEPLSPSGTNDEKEAIRRIVRVGSNIPTYPVGGLLSQDTYNMRDEWGVDPVTVRKARNL